MARYTTTVETPLAPEEAFAFMADLTNFASRRSRAAKARATYDAELTLRGPLRLFDRGLQVVFDRLGDRAAAGLRKALRADGSRP